MSGPRSSGGGSSDKVEIDISTIEQGAPGINSSTRPQAAAEPESADGSLPRHINILGQNKFCSNRACTSRFTTLNFLPLALMEQLHPINKFVNVYFLFAGGMQMIQPITLTDGMPMIWFNVRRAFARAPHARSLAPSLPRARHRPARRGRPLTSSAAARAPRRWACSSSRT